MKNLEASELGYTEWFVAPAPNNKWVVARNYDTISVDDQGEICYGMSSDFDSEHDTEPAATERWRQVVGTKPKEGYIYCK